MVFEFLKNRLWDKRVNMVKEVLSLSRLEDDHEAFLRWESVYGINHSEQVLKLFTFQDRRNILLMVIRRLLPNRGLINDIRRQ